MCSDNFDTWTKPIKVEGAVPAFGILGIVHDVVKENKTQE